MTTVSLCVIAKDEEQYIGDCLESTRDVVDEIILVDTGSSDATMTIAARYGAKIVEVPWRNSFAAAKNETLKHAKSDWILALDADERLSKVNCEKIRQLLENPQYHVYLLQQRSGYVRKDGIRGICTGLVGRLFRNNVGLRYYGSIHEGIITHRIPDNIRIANTNIIIDHLGFLHNIGDKFQRNLSVAKRRKIKHNAFSRYDMARTYAALGRYPESEKQLWYGLRFDNAAAWLHAQMYVLLGDIQTHVGNSESSGLVSWSKAAEIDAAMVAPRLRLGRCYYHQAEYENAIEQFQRIIELLSSGSLRGVVMDDECTVPDAWASLAACYARTGRGEMAMDAMVRSRTPVAENETFQTAPWCSEFYSVR